MIWKNFNFLDFKQSLKLGIVEAEQNRTWHWNQQLLHKLERKYNVLVSRKKIRNDFSKERNFKTFHGINPMLLKLHSLERILVRALQESILGTYFLSTILRLCLPLEYINNWYFLRLASSVPPPLVEGKQDIDTFYEIGIKYAQLCPAFVFCVGSCLWQELFTGGDCSCDCLLDSEGGQPGLRSLIPTFFHYFTQSS